jgi:DNA-binding protein H-NS
MNDALAVKLDLARFSLEELGELIPLIEGEIERRKEEKQTEALEKMREVATSVGMTPEELLGLPARRRRRGGGRGRREPIAWQHPDDPSLVYRGGRKPQWMQELKEEGREPVKVEGV